MEMEPDWNGHVIAKYNKILRETGRAILIIVYGRVMWLPKQLIVIDSGNRKISMPMWLAKKRQKEVEMIWVVKRRQRGKKFL
jgi:hypothetical protein